MINTYRYLFNKRINTFEDHNIAWSTRNDYWSRYFSAVYCFFIITERWSRLFSNIPYNSFDNVVVIVVWTGTMLDPHCQTKTVLIRVVHVIIWMHCLIKYNKDAIRFNSQRRKTVQSNNNGIKGFWAIYIIFFLSSNSSLPQVDVR